MKELIIIIFLHLLILQLNERVYKNIVSLYVKAVKIVLEQWKKVRLL